MSDAPDDDLAVVFAEIARRLHGAATQVQALDRIARAAVDTVPGCDHAAVSLVRRSGRVETAASTDDVPSAADAIQYEVGQGPCLEAITEHEVYQVDDLATDERWPLFSRRAAEEIGVHSMLSFRLFVEQDTIGALNLYSRRGGAFDAHGRAVGSILATHAALGIRSARDREHAIELDRAVRSNREIGLAMGILMARGPMTQEEAFTLLRRASQHLNRKLRDVATDVVETGQLPERNARHRPP